MVTFTLTSIWWYGSVLGPPAPPGIHGKFGQGGLPGLSPPFHRLAQKTIGKQQQQHQTSHPPNPTIGNRTEQARVTQNDSE